MDPFKKEQKLQEEVLESQFVELAKLPSRGALYDEDHPLCDEEFVEIKHLTATEENILTSAGLIKSGKFVDTLMKSVMKNKLINPDDLFVGDKNAILITIRVSSFGPEYRVNLVCTNQRCRKEYIGTFMLDQLELKMFDKDNMPSGVQVVGRNLFETLLPVSKSKVRFKLLTQKAYDEIEQAQENRIKAMMKSKLPPPEVDTFSTDKLVKCIESVDGKTSKDHISKWVSKLPIKDSRRITSLIKKIEPKVIMKQEITCPHCRDKKEVNMPLTVEFFWPEGEDDESD